MKFLLYFYTLSMTDNLKQYPRNANQYTSNVLYDINQIVDKKTFDLYDKAMENNTNIVTPIREISRNKLSKTLYIETMNNSYNKNNNAYNQNNNYQNNNNNNYQNNNNNYQNNNSNNNHQNNNSNNNNNDYYDDNDSMFSDDASINNIKYITSKLQNNKNNHNNNSNNSNSNKNNSNSQNRNNSKMNFLDTQEQFLNGIPSDNENSPNSTRYGSPIDDASMTNDNTSLEGFETQFNQLKLNYNGIPATMQNVGNNYKVTNNEKVTASQFNPNKDGRYGATNEATHNNMMPFFKTKSYGYNPEENEKRNNNWNETMRLFTGSDQMIGFSHKTETKPFFKPAATQVESVTGMPNFSDYMQSRVIPSQTMNGVKPFQPIMQTPGLNLGYNEQGNTGKQDLYRALPRTIDELRTTDNPQTSYTLPVNEAGLKYDKGAVIGEYKKQKPDRYYENSYDSMLPNDAPFLKPTLVGKYNVPITNREETAEKKYLAPAKNINGDKIYQTGQFKTSTKQHAEETGPRNVIYDTRNQNITRETFQASDTNRSQTTNTKYINNVVGNKQENSLINYKNMIPNYNQNKETEQTEQTITNIKGNYQSVPVQNFNTVFDINNRNTTNANQLGNASNHVKDYIYNYINSIPDETLRSILSEKILIGNAQGNSERNYLFNAKNAIKDPNMRNLTENNAISNLQGNHDQNYMFNAKNAIQNPNMRNLTENNTISNLQGNSERNYLFNKKNAIQDPNMRNLTENNAVSNLQGNRDQNYLFNAKNAIQDPNMRNLTENNTISNLKGNHNQNYLFDAKNAVQDPTMRNLSENNVYIKPLSNKEQSYVFNYVNSIPDPTLKELINTCWNGMLIQGNFQQSAMFNYKNNTPDVTLREMVEQTKHLKALIGEKQKSTLFNYDNSVPDVTLKEQVEKTKHLLGVANQYLQKSQMYNYDDKAKTTLRELTENMKHLLNIGNQILHKDRLFDYENNIPDATIRSMTENTKNIAGTKGNYEQERSRLDANNMLVNTQKEIILTGRKPTNTKGNKGYTTVFTQYTFNDDNNSQSTLMSGVRPKPIDFFS